MTSLRQFEVFDRCRCGRLCGVILADQTRNLSRLLIDQEALEWDGGAVAFSGIEGLGRLTRVAEPFAMR